ncbi:hypothetical protein BDA96_05G103300 [Sorghum bicolor]|uniref:Uncharacterized protein n=2 Tax=Sorghum bicolor TaxID=4558 RepID=A0A921UF95_SORBI|nr:hypothetical protein BDA96_05G103300 [Sorghum bicolor]OQU83270.1 hypothetical protein SORBI_3005G100250 [Sorghum bicolor]
MMQRTTPSPGARLLPAHQEEGSRPKILASRRRSSGSLCPSVPSISLIYTAVTVVSVHAFPSFQIAAAA